MLAAAVLVPWTVTTAFFDPVFVPKLLVASLLAGAGSLLSLREPARGPLPLAWPLAAFLGVATLSSALASDPAVSFLGSHMAYGWCLLGWLPCLLLFMTAAGQQAPFAAKLAGAIALASIPVSVFGFAQMLGLDPRVGERLPTGRIFSTFSSPVTLGAYLAASLPLAAYAAARGSSFLRPAAAGAALLAVAALALTGSRAGWVAAVAGVSLYRWLAEGPGGFKGARGALLAAAALACSFGLVAVRGERSLSDRQRVELWRAAGRLFLERPLLGVGPQGYAAASRAVYSEEYASSIGGREAQNDAHNDWLQVLCGLGLAGALAYAWLHWGLFRLASSALAHRRAEAAAFASGLAALGVAVKLNGASWTAPFMAALLSGGLAACRGREDEGVPKGGGSRAWPAAATATLGALCAAAALWLALADRRAQAGARARAEGRPREAAERLEAAVKLRPYEGMYRQALANLLWDVGSAAGPGDRAVLLRRAAEVAGRGLALRPADPGLAGLAAWAELRRYQWAGEPRLDAARTLFAHGLALDPHSAALLEGAFETAKAGGDAALAARLEDELFRLNKKR